jgi:hypothetical protein
MWAGPLVGKECSLGFGPKDNPIRVTSITARSFTFRTLPGHSEGANKLITFSFSQDPETCDLTRTVRACGKNNLRRGTARPSTVASEAIQTGVALSP